MFDAVEEIVVSGSITVSVGTEQVLLDYAEWRGRAWLISEWTPADGGAFRVPRRMIAPKMRDRSSPHGGVELLQVFKRLPLLPEVLHGDPPPSCWPLLDIVDSPPVVAKAKAAVEVEFDTADRMDGSSQRPMWDLEAATSVS